MQAGKADGADGQLDPMDVKWMSFDALGTDWDGLDDPDEGIDWCSDTAPRP